MRLNGPSSSHGFKHQEEHMEKTRLAGYKTWICDWLGGSHDGDESQLIGIPFSFLKKKLQQTNPRTLGTMKQVGHLVTDD